MTLKIFISIFLIGLLFRINVYSQETLQTISENGNTTTLGLGLYGGGAVANKTWKIDGPTMGYRIPLWVRNNSDYLGLVMDQAAIRFDIPYDALDGVPTELLWVYPSSGIPYMRREGTDHTILKIWSPRESRGAYESTLALVNGDQSQEFLDLYNMSYPSNHSYGIRMQKRNGGAYKPFHFEYSDGLETYPVFTLNSEKTAQFYGNVSIGTTDSKGYMLAVAGNLIAESATVKLESAWPDYVFADDYQLSELEEIAKYIEEYKRLPDMPSAAAVAKHGLNIGEVNVLMVEKLEEIFLYLIEQDKRIKELEKENLELGKKPSK